MYSSLVLDTEQPPVTFEHPVWTDTDILSKELTDSILTENFGTNSDYSCSNTSSEFLFDIDNIAAANGDTTSDGLINGIDTGNRFVGNNGSDQFIFHLESEDGSRLSIYNTGSTGGIQNSFESIPDALCTFDAFVEFDLLNDCLNIGDSIINDDTHTDYAEVSQTRTCSTSISNNSISWPTVDYATAKRRSLLYDKNEFVKLSSSPKCVSPDRSKPKTTTKSFSVTSPTQSTDFSDHQRTYRCPVLSCDKKYLKASHLRSHVRRHTGVKPFACDWHGCEWRFSRSDELARHKRSHSGIKPYACDICEKAFSRSDHLSKHAKVHMKKMAMYGTPVITKKCNYKYLSINTMTT